MPFRKKVIKLKEKVILLSGSIIFCLALLFLGELICRKFCKFPFLTTSKKLFIRNAYGASIGNARNIEAVSFGTKVYTDENGFRVLKDKTCIAQNYKVAILILGDSVGFGSGIEEENTFSGRLSLRFPQLKIYNSSVIGYAVYDYKNVVIHFLPTHPEVKKVFLVFCLNDIAFDNVQMIENVLGISKERNFHDSFISTFENISFLRKLNEFFRSHSKLYLLVRHTLIDSQMLFWKEDEKLYDDKDDLRTEKIMQNVVDIDRLLRKRGIDFTVVISPYEAQFRDSSPLKRRPQEKLARFFKKYGINYIDTYEKFKNSSSNSKMLFLTGDPMHLSEKGHQVIYNIILDYYKNRGNI
jgi:lysophospholipase L1-like esterase